MHKPATNEAELQLAAELGYQPEEPPVRSIAVFTAGLFIVVIVTTIITYFIYLMIMPDFSKPIANQTQLPAPKTTPPPPVLQTDPIKDINELNAEADRLLHSMEIIDSNAGVVRIPIERAIDVIVENGLPVPPEVEAPAQ
ncbi:MAG: hypothetical protein HUU60_01800 [Armatimonadetes bacterium]|nr:hypothetical protein [Armatimonadota bacterium]